MNFTSSVVPAEDLMKAVYDALKSMKFVLESSVDSAMASGTTKSSNSVSKTKKRYLVYSSVCSFILQKFLKFLRLSFLRFVRSGKGIT